MESLGCDVIQGFLVGHPMPAEGLDRWRKRGMGSLLEEIRADRSGRPGRG